MFPKIHKMSSAEKIKSIAEYDKFINEFKTLPGNKFVDETLVVQYIGSPILVIEKDDRIDEFIFFESTIPQLTRKITISLIFVETKTRLGNISYRGPGLDELPLKFTTFGFYDEGTIEGRYSYSQMDALKSSEDIFSSFISYIDECLRALELQAEWFNEQSKK